MPFKRTSVEGKVYEVSRKPLQAHLYDFDVDGDVVKPAHIRWLNQMVIQPARLLGSTAPGQWHIWIFGNASTTGGRGHNLALGERRARQVRSLLEIHLGGTPHVLHVVPVGEEKAERDGLPDEIELDFYRSVTIVVGFHTSPPPPPRRPSLPSSTKLELRVTKVVILQSGFGIGILDFSHSLAIVHFEIRDQRGCEVASYRLKDTIADLTLGSGVPIPDVPEYTLWPLPTVWRAFDASSSIDSFAGWGRVLDVDESSLSFRLSRRSAAALKGLTFAFHNPVAPVSKPSPLQPLPGIPVPRILGGLVERQGPVRPCR